MENPLNMQIDRPPLNKRLYKVLSTNINPGGNTRLLSSTRNKSGTLDIIMA